MKSIQHANDTPNAAPLIADELLELHAARLVLLISICGTRDRVKGLTKLAKLDFFVRYPQLFDKLFDPNQIIPAGGDGGMIRHHYGPWDNRYYHVISYLESKRIVDVKREGNAFVLSLTDQGKIIAKNLQSELVFAPIVKHMGRVAKELGSKTGNSIKEMIYQLLDEEVAALKLGTEIKNVKQ